MSLTVSCQSPLGVVDRYWLYPLSFVPPQSLGYLFPLSPRPPIVEHLLVVSDLLGMRLVWILTWSTAAVVSAGVGPSISMNMSILLYGGRFGVETSSVELRLDDIVSSFSRIFNLFSIS